MKESPVVDVSEIPVVDQVTAERLYSGLDADSPEVEACERRHRNHKWVSIMVDRSRVSPVLEHIEVILCARCCVRRCEAGVVKADPESICIYPIEHDRPHRDARSRWREVGSMKKTLTR
jgi:hypothetical protein